jgi:hypothetical protein
VRGNGIETTSASGRTSPVSDIGEGSKKRTIAGAIKALFKAAVKAVTQREEAPQPETRRGAGEKDGRGFARVNYDHCSRNSGKPSARGHYAALRVVRRTAAKVRRKFSRAANDATEPDIAEEVFNSITGFDLVTMWQQNANAGQYLDQDFSASQDRYFPQP